MLTCLFCFCVIFLFKAHPWFSFESSNGDFWIGSSFVSKQIFLVTSGCPRNSCPISGTVYTIYMREPWIDLLAITVSPSLCCIICVYSFFAIHSFCFKMLAWPKEPTVKLGIFGPACVSTLWSFFQCTSVFWLVQCTTTYVFVFISFCLFLY